MDKKKFYQWDLNRRIALSDVEAGTEIDFCNPMSKETKCIPVFAYDENGVVYADVPNVILQIAGIFKVYVWPFHTTQYHQFTVIPRPKPADYIYEEVEIYTIEQVVNEALEKAKESGEFDAELTEGSVTTEILDDKAVTREKIASGAVTLDKLNEGTRKAFVPTATSQGLYAYDWLYEDAYGQPVFGNKTIQYSADVETPWGWEIVQRDGDGFINAKTPKGYNHVANKGYVDAVKQGLEETVGNVGVLANAAFGTANSVQEELGDIDAALEDIDAMLDELIIPNGDEVAY